MPRTKIVATIGPASSEPAILEQLLRAGVDVVRLNFSHGTHDQHAAVLHHARRLAEQQDRPLAVLQDLSGPKIRVGELRDGQPVELRDGATLTLTTEPGVVGTADLIGTTYTPLPRDVHAGDRILLDDGQLELRVLGTGGERVRCQIEHGGWLKPHKGINLPGVALSTPALTEKDRQDLAFGLELGVDFVALSFVRRATDIADARRIIEAAGADKHIIAKIEKPEAVNELQDIIAAADGVMVARGDLGVELSTEEVPTLQKRIIAATNNAGKVVITATQMLESMITNPRPTRAEASDVANAILDGTDAVMLSAETASGRYPVQAVETMARIAYYTESHLAVPPPTQVTRRGTAATRSLTRVAREVAEQLGCRVIVAFTESGMTAELASTFQPSVDVVALTPHTRTYRRLALWWGVRPLIIQEDDTTDAMIERGEAILKERGYVRSGDVVVMLTGHSRTTGATNMLRVHTVG